MEALGRVVFLRPFAFLYALVEMNKKYKNPPIVEALCEFRFGSESPWDMTMPGLVYGALSDDYPDRKQAVQAVSFNISGSVVDEEMNQRIQTSERVQFIDKAGSGLVQIGANLLVINQLKPYNSWEEFLPKIKKANNAYCDVVHPRRIRDVLLRYINHIVIESHEIDLSKYFDFYPHIGTSLPSNHGGFIAGAQFPLPEKNAILKIEIMPMVPVEPEEKYATVRLDLDMSLMDSDEINHDNVFDWIEVAHSEIVSGFEGSIKEPLREMLDLEVK